MLNALLGRFITDEVLREAQDKVGRVEQSGLDDEAMFSERISKLLECADTCSAMMNKSISTLKAC